MRYRLNTPDVIQETVDGEALIIHTLTGVYFSLQDTAEYVWGALLAGHTPEEIAGAYRADDPDVAAAVAHFAQQLADEQLLVPGDQSTTPGVLAPAAAPFTVPTFQKFTDMQELLLVDPIHEVDPQSGWPVRRDSD